MNLKRHPKHLAASGGPAAALAALLLLYSANGTCDSLVPTVVNNVDMGTITPGSSSTTFTVSSSGTVTQTPASGSGGATRSTSGIVNPLQVSLNCSINGTGATAAKGCASTSNNIILSLDVPNTWTVSLIDIPTITSVSTTNMGSCSWSAYDTTNNTITGNCTTTSTTPVWPAVFTFTFNFLVGVGAYSTYPGTNSGTITATATWAW